MNEKHPKTLSASNTLASEMTPSATISKQVLIVGSGFGGTYALRKMLSILRKNEKIKVTMVSDENFFMFTPLLHMVAMGIIETRHLSSPIRRIQKGDQFEFVQAEVKNFDLTKKMVNTSLGILRYDYLLIGLGSVTHMPEFDYPKNSPNLFTLKTLVDSVYIRNHIINIFEKASIEEDPQKQRQLLTFVIAGAGYTGIQLVTELRDFIFRSLTRFYRNVDHQKIRIIVVEAEDRIMPDSKPKLVIYISHTLKNMGIEVRLNSRITGILEDQVIINDSEKIKTDTVLWITGVVSNPRISEIEAATDHMGRVLVDDYLAVPGFDGVYAAGDCTNYKDHQTGIPIPPRAHTTVRQAKIAAYNILADIRGHSKKPYRFSNPFDTVSLGTQRAVFRYNNFYLFGLPARFIWLSGYLLLMAGVYNRVRILADWVLSAIFGRDITNVKLKN